MQTRPARLFMATCALGIPLTASAGGFNVNPTKVELDERRTSQLITIDNSTNRPLRFEVTAEAWTETLDGTMTLSPTEDVVVFPTLITIGPESSRRLRIGTTNPSGDLEASYRVFVNELPPLPGKEAEGIQVVTRVGIPVFIEPHKRLTQGEIVDIEVRDDVLAVTVANTGTVHARVADVVVHGLGPKGGNLFTTGARGWYVLPNTRRVFEIPLPDKACDALSLDIVANTHIGRWSAEMPFGPDVCKP